MPVWLIVVVSLLGLCIVLLFVPLDIHVSMHRYAKFQGFAGFRWLFGLVRFKLDFPGTKEDEAKEESVAAKKQTTPHKKRGRRLFGIVRQRAFRQRILKFLEKLLHATHPRDLYLGMRIGLDDPAETGQLWALVGPLTGLAYGYQGANIQIEPEFCELAFEFDMQGKFSLIPLQLIALAVTFALSPTMLRVWWAIR